MIKQKKEILMRKIFFIISACLIFIAMSGMSFAANADKRGASNSELKQEMDALKIEINGLKKKVGSKSEANSLTSVLSGFKISGGISAGPFYASNPGEDVSDNDFLLSNFLVEISSSDESLPVCFSGAFGETSTPSLLDAPENNTDFDIEYASVIVKPADGLSLEVGLLAPNAGYEDTYTYNNANIVTGVTASQQPYNAYGARFSYSTGGIGMYAGYYKTRLDNDEYRADGSSPDNSWEAGITASAWGFDYTFYHYRLNGLKNLTGVVAETTIENVYLALNADYWRWDRDMDHFYGRRSSTACAFYISPTFGKFSFPLRLEYINQGQSRIYTDSMKAKRIYTATLTPTYHFTDNSYFRVEGSYINADGAFADRRGNVKNSRAYLAAEVGFIF